MKKYIVLMTVLLGLEAQAGLESLTQNIQECFNNQTESSMFINKQNREDFQITAEVKCGSTYASELFTNLSLLDQNLIEQTQVLADEIWISFGRKETSYSTTDGKLFSLRGVNLLTSGSTCKRQGLENYQYECTLEFKMTLDSDLSNSLRDSSNN